MATTRGRRRGRPKMETPEPVDIHVGMRVRQRRNQLSLSQEKLGERIGLTFQQVQKYERGSNRIGASRLYEIGQVLEVPPSYFFEEQEQAGTQPGGDYAGFAEAPAASFESDPLRRGEAIDLVNAYFSIDDASVRRRLFELAKALATDTDS